jgi:hypothetical protein
LKRFVVELERVKPTPGWRRSHAITCDDKGFYVLLGLGDTRAKLCFDELDEDPIGIAAAAVARWRSDPRDELVVN